MIEVSEFYNVSVFKDGKEFYANMSYIGGGMHTIYIVSKYETKSMLSSIVYAKNLKSILERAIKDNGGTFNFDDYVFISDDFDYNNIERICIKKKTITTKIEEHYLGDD